MHYLHHNNAHLVGRASARRSACIADGHIAAPIAAAPRRGGVVARRRRRYYYFILPAVVVIGAVILFPWLFTVWMSVFEWKIGSTATFVGLDNYTGLFTNRRFLEAVVRTFYFTVLAVVAPLDPRAPSPR